MTNNMWEHKNPFVGPRAYETNETIYGRDIEAEQLASLLIADRIVLLYSPSGAGKTSLIQAKLINTLRDDGFQPLPIIRVNAEPPLEFAGLPGFNRYTLSALCSLETAFQDNEQIPLSELATLSFGDYLDRRYPVAGTTYVVLMIDQFEEVLTASLTDQSAKHVFFAQLDQALADSRRWCLIAIREDYIGALEPYLSPIRLHFGNTYRLDLLGEAAARQVMVETAKQGQVDFMPEAARKLVDDLRQVFVQGADRKMERQLGPYVEPVQLQVVCHRLWEYLEPGDTDITEEEVSQLGDVNRALAEYYDACVDEAARTTGTGQRAIREWFERRLISENEQEIRTPVPLGADQGLPDAAIREIENKHLVRIEKRGGVSWCELAHDRLIRPVRESNEEWRQRNLSLLQRQATFWEEKGRSDGLLLSGKELVEAENWADNSEDVLLPLEREYLEACRRKRNADMLEKRNNRRIRLLAAISFFLLLLTLSGLGGTYLSLERARLSEEKARQEEQAAKALQAVAQDQERNAKTQAQIARKSEELALEQEKIAKEQKQIAKEQEMVASAREITEAAINTINTDPELSILLALQVIQNNPGEELLPETMDALEQAVQASRLRRTYAGYLLAGWEMDFSPDGRQIASVGDLNLIKIWDPETGEDLQSFKSEGFYTYALDFHPDGRRLASAGCMHYSFENQSCTEGYIAINTVDGGKLLSSFAIPKEEVFNIAFNKDGSKLVSIQGKSGPITTRTIRVWDVANGSSLFDIPENNLLEFSLSPSGTMIAGAFVDGMVKIWDVDTGEEITAFHAHDNQASAPVFSPDETLLATGGQDITFRIWDISDLSNDVKELAKITGHPDTVQSLAFDPTGRYLASASSDGVIKIWDIRQPPSTIQVLVTLSGQTGLIREVEYSPDGLLLASVSNDGSIKVWDAQVGHSSLIWAVDYNPSGKQIATASMDGQAILWAVQSDPILQVRIQHVLSGHSNAIFGVDFSPDGSQVATASYDGSIKVWDTGTGNLLKTLLPDVEGPLWRVVFSSDGRRIVGISNNNPTIWVWDTQTGELLSSATLGVLSPHYITFSNDGKWLAAGGYNSTATIWEWTGSQARNPFSLVHPGNHWLISSLIFNPDSDLLVTGTYNGTITLWDTASWSALPIKIAGNSHVTNGLDISPNGSILASASFDRTAKLWDILSGEMLITLTHPAAVYDVAFSPDGKYLATVGADNQLRLFPIWLVDLIELAEKRVTRALRIEECQKYLHMDACPSSQPVEGVTP